MAGMANFFWTATLSKKDATNFPPRQKVNFASAEFGAHRLTKRCQYLPVHRDSLDAPIRSMIVDSFLIRNKDFVRGVCDDIDTKRLRALCFSVVYHRRQRDHESPAFVCPFHRTNLPGGENEFVPWDH
jgi:hypothetical protein